MSENWKKYQEYMFKVSSYSLLLSTAHFDSQTVAPKKGTDYRNERLAFLEGEYYSLVTSEELYQLLNQLAGDEQLDETRKKIIAWQLRDLENIRCVPKDVFVESSMLMMQSEQKWEEAKQTENYQLFKPYLLKVIEMRKKLISYRNCDMDVYDQLLNDYEPAMNKARYDEFFDLIKEKLVPLIKKISQQPQIDDGFVYRHYPVEQQKKLMKMVMEYIDFDFDAGVLAETEHPFTSSLQKNDNRITTHYYENNLISSIFSVIHESGHANYNHQVDDSLADTYVFDNMSMGMHESQSRLFENYLGRSYHFWDNLFEPMKQLFAEQLKDVDQQKFVDAVNKVTCSLIRTEADELTYPLHILIRYEIEKGIFDGNIDLEKLDEIWDQKYQQYLGVRASKPSEGILQDVHWSDGSFGYFPTYALGSGYAAQFVVAMAKDIDIDKCLHDNDFKTIKAWLREHIHKYGGLNTPAQQMLIATGESFDPHYYINYLTDKYSKLYGLEK